MTAVAWTILAGHAAVAFAWIVVLGYAAVIIRDGVIARRRQASLDRHAEAMRRLGRCHRNVVGPGVQPGTDAHQRRGVQRRKHPAS